jgi:hypothetical protein
MDCLVIHHPGDLGFLFEVWANEIGELLEVPQKCDPAARCVVQEKPHWNMGRSRLVQIFVQEKKARAEFNSVALVHATRIGECHTQMKKNGLHNPRFCGTKKILVCRNVMPWMKHTVTQNRILHRIKIHTGKHKT